MGRITIKEVAKEAGVSTATVSYVMNGKKNIPEATREQVLAASQKLGYVSNYSARSMRMNRSNLIGVIIPQTEPGSQMVFENPFYSEILSSIEYCARLSGYHVIVSGTNADENYLKLAQQRNLDGIIIIGMYKEPSYPELRASRIPIVLVDSYTDDHYFHTIRINDRHAGYIATRHLIENGHRKIAFLSGAIKEGGVMKLRLAGYFDALDEYGIPHEERYLLTENISFDSGRRLARRMAQTLDVTAAFCTADILAVGVIKELNESERLIPSRYSVVGVDNLSIARYSIPGLTTVGQNIYSKGEKAVEMILNAIADPSAGKQEFVLPITLVERESVRNISRT